jgi:hypothetical protein
VPIVGIVGRTGGGESVLVDVKCVTILDIVLLRIYVRGELAVGALPSQVWAPRRRGPGTVAP